MVFRNSLIAALVPVAALAQNPASVGPRDAYQIRYAANLDQGDSIVNISNAGTAQILNEQGVDTFSLCLDICDEIFPEPIGPGGSTIGECYVACLTGPSTPAASPTAICANVYAFSTEEQMTSCCSCAVTPDALVSLSARRDLLSNNFTRAMPTSLMLKLIASRPLVGGGCNPSSPTSTTLVRGMVAWGTTVHVLSPTFPVPPPITETRFTAATLSSSELARLTQICGFIQNEGSGYGICRSCQPGGLGAAKQ